MSDAAVMEPPVREVESESDKPKTKRQKPWAVIVLNDEDHTFAYVMELFQKVFFYDELKCFILADMINTQGRAIVWSGSREVAELKRDQLKGGGKDFYAGEKPVEYPLGCYIEEMP